MNSNFLRRGAVCAAVVIFASVGRGDAATNDPALTALGKQALELLQERDAERFAAEAAPSLADWRSVCVTNDVAANAPDPLGADFQKGLDYQQKSVAESARKVLSEADRLGLIPSRVHFQVKEVVGKQLGNFKDPRVPLKADGLPYASSFRVILTGEPVAGGSTSNLVAGEYELAMGGAQQFPAGWRAIEGIRWASMPEAVADERLRADMRLNTKIAAHSDAIHAADDPALGQLGELVARLIAQRDETVFETNALRSREECWNEFQTLDPKQRPPRAQFDEFYGTFHQQIFGSAQGLLVQADRLGLDFTNAQITVKDVVAENCHQRRGFGSLAGTSSGQTRFLLAVQSDRKTKNGKSMSGDYVITASGLLRGADKWTLEDKIRWEKFPAGLLGPEELKTLEFENYVAKHGALPPGTAVPDIEFTRINDQSKGRLADFRGKVLVLDWWATSCGPCQQSMAELQKLRGSHPEWSNRVELVTISIDDQLTQARAHLLKRDWTNTVNVWAGADSWFSPAAKAFRLHGIPTCYVISPEGKVIQAGHFMGQQLPELVSRLLRK